MEVLVLVVGGVMAGVYLAAKMINDTTGKQDTEIVAGTENVVVEDSAPTWQPDKE